ncbi:polysaccharide pyruvyl transferase family protein [Parasphingorhabdus sp.]|uniref:polysaccharide pyruvyl transferase family protein n=1 Tax=Parasphingorhabdus sp. TaxID=2709688 RepID=UPI003A921D64
MKAQAKTIASTGHDLLAWLAQFGHHPRGVVAGSNVCLLAPAWQGSLGDEAVITAACQHLKATHDAHITLIGFDKAEPWAKIDLIDERISVADYFKTGGWPQRRRLARQLRNMDAFYLLGTDMLDGHYTEWHTTALLTIAHQAAFSGIPTNLVGFSLKGQPKDSAITGLRRISRLAGVTACLRDPVSLQRFYDATNERGVQTADPAFLLQPDAGEHPVRAWIAESRAAGRLVLGLNLSSHVYDALSSNDRERIEGAMVAAVAALADSHGPVSVLLIPHDIRHDFDDVAICETLAARMAGEKDLEAVVMGPPYKAALIKSITGSLDMVLSSRMHLAIAALGSGTPTACITYQGKFEGLYQHFGIQGCTIAPDEAVDAKILTDFLISLADRRQALATAIVGALPNVTKLARHNFDLAS